MARFKGFDVSGYQPQATNAAWWYKAKALGIMFGIVKLSEGTNYRNPYGTRQIAAIKAVGLTASGYHFARFVGNSWQAQNEARYAVASAHAMGLPNGSALVLDYELRAGWSSSNTQACIAFCRVIKDSGYTPVFYSYSGMKQLWDYEAIYRATGAHFWVAAYPHMGAVTEPDYNYFPSISTHTDAWQYTDNLFGWGVDGSVDFTGVFTTGEKITTKGYLDSVRFDGDKLTISGWFGTDQAQGRPHTWMILVSDDYKREYARQAVTLSDRPDVAKVYHDIPNAGHCGFSATFDYKPEMAGKPITVIMRYSADETGNQDYKDYAVPIKLDKSAEWLDNISTIAYSNKLSISGWFASDLSIGHPYHYMILIDPKTKREYQRIAVQTGERKDVVEKHADIYNAGQSEFSAQFDYQADMVGKQLQVIMRYTDDKDGNGHSVDYYFPPFNGPAMPVLDGKTEQQILVHDVSVAAQKDGTMLVKFK